MNKTKFTVGDIVTMLLDKAERKGIVEEVCGDSLFVRWVMSGTKKVRLCGWILSDWVIKKHFPIVQVNEFSTKQERTAWR